MSDYVFFPACPVADIPEGTKKRVLVEDYPVAIFNVGGTFYAACDPCPHELVSLGSGGSFEGEVVTCGAHRWSFNVRTGECYEDDDPCFRLKQLPIGRKDGMLYVGFVDEDDDEEYEDEE